MFLTEADSVVLGLAREFVCLPGTRCRWRAVHWCHGGRGWLMAGLELTVADKPDISNPCGRGAARRINWESEHPSCQWA